MAFRVLVSSCTIKGKIKKKQALKDNIFSSHVLSPIWAENFWDIFQINKGFDDHAS